MSVLFAEKSWPQISDYVKGNALIILPVGQVEEHGPHLPLSTDIVIAEGVALARKIRKEPRLKELPVLIITGIREQIAFLFPGQPVHPHFVETDELLEKPVEPKLLLEKVGALLKTAEEKKS